MANDRTPQILSDFYDYTHVCIGIFDMNESLICDCPDCPGDCSKGRIPFHKGIHNAINRLKDNSQNFANISLTLNSGQVVGYTACYTNPNQKSNHCYVFGPYKNEKDSALDYPYLPEFAIPPTIDILYSISKIH